VHTRFCWGNLREGDHFEMQGVEWIDMAQDSDMWRALVNAVMNLRIL
jgi:frataxin-like iron-binding protein CyaY